jgi:PIN domain nuclease of toxin-antitoxin system
VLLLDTHCWLWLKAEPERLPSPLRRRLQRDPSKLVLSTASVIEIAAKYASGRLKLLDPPSHLIDALLEDGVVALDVTRTHALRLVTLPRHHRDPFDRLLIAQAQVEGFTLVTADPQILAYDVRAIDARK